MAKEESTQETKKRGAPKGKRPVAFVHAAIKDGKVVMGSYVGSEKESAKAFKAEHGLDSVQSLGPIRKVNEKKEQVSVRESVRLDSNQLLNVTSNQYKGTYKGWNVIGNGLQEMTVGERFYKANELVRVIMDSRVDPDSKDRKPRLGTNDALPLELIENIEELSAQE